MDLHMSFKVSKMESLSLFSPIQNFNIKVTFLSSVSSNAYYFQYEFI